MAKRTADSGKTQQATWVWTQQLVEFGLLLSQKRERLGLSQSEMALRVGIDQSRISRIEMGLGTPKDFPTAQAYAECYKLDEQETNAWYQLLFGVPQLQPEAHGRTVLGVAEAATLPCPVPGISWERSAAAVLKNAATHLQEHFLWEEAIPLFRKAETLFGVAPQAAKAACEIASTYVELGDYAAASQELLRIDNVYAAVMNPDIEREVAFVRGWIDYDQGRFAQAATSFEACLRLIAQMGREQVSTDAHHFLGRVYSDWGKTVRHTPQATTLLHQAAAHFDTAYTLHHAQGKHSGLAYDSFRKAQLFQTQGKWREAKRLRKSARAIFGTEIAFFTLHIDLEEANLLLKDDGDIDCTQRLAQNALDGWSQVKRALGMADALNILGEVQVKQGNLDQALECFVSALCLYPFDQHLRNRSLWAEIRVLTHEIIRVHSGTYYGQLVERFQERALIHQGYLVYLDHVAADRSTDISRIFQQLRTLGQQVIKS